MRMDLIDQTLYPKFTKYIKNDLKSVAKVGSIRRAFMKYGQLDHAGLKRALNWGNNPKVNVNWTITDYGEFQPGVGSNVLQIRRSLVLDFEAGRDWVRNKSGRRVHLAGATVLHELIHWADDQDGKDYKGEEGELFEQAVYGKVLSY